MYVCPDLDTFIVQHLATSLQSISRKTGFKIKWKKNKPCYNNCNQTSEKQINIL